MAPRWKTMAIAGWSFSFGYLAIVGVSAVQERMEIRGNIKLFGDGSGLIFPDGSKQTTAVATETAPYVLGNDSVDSQHYVDGSIDGVHLADGQVASADIADGAIVQADFHTTLQSTYSTDTNTTYTAGTGLDLSGTTFSATVGTTIESAEITDGTIVQADLSAALHTTYSTGVVTQAAYNDLLTRISGLQPATLTLDATGNVGQYTSVAIGTDNKPVISYQDVTNGDLKVYVCAATDCASGTARTLDATGYVGHYTSLAIGTDNKPVISYYDNTNDDLRRYRCRTTDCS